MRFLILVMFIFLVGCSDANPVIEGEVTRIEFGKEHHGSISNHDFMVVEFRDGRTIKFWGVSSKPIPIGRYVIITYKRDNIITDVTVKDEK